MTDPQGFEVATEEREIKKDSERRTRKNNRGETTGVTEFSLAQDGAVQEMRRLDPRTGRIAERVLKYENSFFRSKYGEQGEEILSEHYDAKTGKLHSQKVTEYNRYKGKQAGKKSETETRYVDINGMSTEKTTWEYYDPECKVEKRSVSVKNEKDFEGKPQVTTLEHTYDKKGRIKARQYKTEGGNPYFSNVVSLFEKGNKTHGQPNTEVSLDANGNVLQVITDRKFDRHGQEISHTVLNPADSSRIEETISFDKAAGRYVKNEVRKTRETLNGADWKEKARERVTEE